MSRATVRLNVYDMYWLNDYASNIGVGIFHSGVEVYGVEYAYGGHPYAFTGVFENSPQDSEELGENFKFRESIILGETDFTSGDVRDLMKSLGHDFRGDKYHLINRNCNHFSAIIAKTLTGRDIPGWINRLANISGSIPFLEKVLPQEWLTPVALQQSINHPSPSNSSRAKRPSVESADEMTETYGSRLSARQGGESRPLTNIRTTVTKMFSNTDSRTTILRGVTGDLNTSSDMPSSSINGDLSTSSSSNSSSDEERGSSNAYIRIWNQIKNTVAGENTPIKP